MHEYEDDIIIDESGLDTEWLAQPALMLKYGRAAAQAGRAFDLAKEKLEIVIAELDKDIRKNSDDFEISKITESVVEHTIRIQPSYLSANGECVEAKYEFELSKYAVRAFDQRKLALENLVRLHGQQYFAGPQVPRDLTKEWERKRKQDKVDDGIATKMKRKRGGVSENRNR